MCVCVGATGVYENGTYIYNGDTVYLYVVAVPTSRLVHVSCALNCGFLRSVCRSISLFLVCGLAVSCCLMHDATVLDCRVDRIMLVAVI